MAEPEAWLTRGTLSVGLASLASDAGHELTTSLLPSLLSATLHASPAALGIIEGSSDAVMGLSKLVGGPLSNDPPRRARLATGGYLLTGLATAAIGLASSVGAVALLRAIAWASRGVRSPARDMMLVSLVPPEAYGRASGVERAGDNLGALVGPLLAAGLVVWVGVREAILLSFLPSLLAVLAIGIAARESARVVSQKASRRSLGLHLTQLRHAGAVRILTPVALFELGNLATSLLILRATQLLHVGGRSLTTATSVAILLYAAHNLVASLASLGAGQMVDRLGAPVAFAAGAAVYVAAYALFAVQQHSWLVLLAAFALAGVGIGMAETAESAAVALRLPEDLRGNGFGLLGLVQAGGDLGATLLAGILWTAFGAPVAFGYVAGWMAASLLASTLLGGPRQSPVPGSTA